MVREWVNYGGGGAANTYPQKTQRKTYVALAALVAPVELLLRLVREARDPEDPLAPRADVSGVARQGPVEGGLWVVRDVVGVCFGGSSVE